MTDPIERLRKIAGSLDPVDEYEKPSRYRAWLHKDDPPREPNPVPFYDRPIPAGAGRERRPHEYDLASRLTLRNAARDLDRAIKKQRVSAGERSGSDFPDEVWVESWTVSWDHNDAWLEGLVHRGEMTRDHWLVVERAASELDRFAGKWLQQARLALGRQEDE